MELAGVVLGAVPIIVEAIKAWKTVHQKLRIFRHYSREVKKIYDKVRVQQCVFENELESLLVATGIPSDEAQRMLVDHSHSRWSEADTDEKIAKQLNKDSEIYQNLVESVANALREVQKELKAFDCLLSQRAQQEKLKDTVVRLRLATRISFKRSDYEQHVESLRQDIADLRAIGSYRIQSSVPRAWSTAISKQLPPSVSKIRKACHALYEALDGSWSCVNPDHAQHAAKLCLQAHVEDSVRLDLALSCTSKDTTMANTSTPPPLWLYVRSLTDTVGSNVAKQGDDFATVAGHDKKQACHKRIKTKVSPAIIHTGRDLRSSPSVCDSLSQCRCLTHSEECLGYVETSDASIDRLRHLFYHRCTQQSTNTTPALERDLPTYIQSSQATLTLEEQLQLAHGVAKAVLQFHSTPWMANEWRLKDISFFQVDGQEAAQALETMHVTTNFQSKQTASNGTSLTAQAQVPGPQSSLDSRDCTDLQCLYGVPNLILFSLGVALLEIGHRQPLESFRHDRDPNDTFTARRLAQRPSLLGPKYQRIAQRCLRCDFGCGSELEQDQLQGAVYNDVICQLGEMLQAFKI